MESYWGKIIILLLKGFIGIGINRHISINSKYHLYIDYIFLLSTVFLIEMKILPVWNKSKPFYISAFKYSIYLENIYSFTYLFIEIFCTSQYAVEKDIDLYVDAGANIGLTILWYKHFNPQMNILAFEPDPASYSLLIKNLKINKIKNYKIYTIALSDRKSESIFYRLKDKVQILDSGLHLNQDLPFEKFKVKTDRLSQYIKSEVSLLKIDIEGEEYNVLNDLLHTKKIRLIKHVIFESHIFTKTQSKVYAKLITQLSLYGTLKSVQNSKVSYLNYWNRN